MRDLGDTVDLPDQIGRFRIKRVLGSGAMGVVCLAEDPVLGREVAIKAIQLHPGLSEKQIVELRQRFETEARAAAKLAHPNLVTIFGWTPCWRVAVSSHPKKSASSWAS
jgi:serine/threonine protein kinase